MKSKLKEIKKELVKAGLNDLAKELIKSEELVESGDQSKIENLIRDHLSGTDRVVSKVSMFNLVKTSLPSLKAKQFEKVWDELIEDDFLIEKGNGYIWEM